MTQYEFTIGLRLRHPDIDPPRITAALGIEPQHAWRAGDPRRGDGGERIDGVYRESYWMARLMERPQLSSEAFSVESVLLQARVQLRRAQRFLKQFKSDGGIAELHVSLYARDSFSLNLPSESLAALALLELSVAIDVYSVSPVDIPPAQSGVE